MSEIFQISQISQISCKNFRYGGDPVQGGGGLVGELVPVTAVSLYKVEILTSSPVPPSPGGYTGRQHCLSHGDAEQGEQESGHGKRVGETATGEFGQKRANLIYRRRPKSKFSVQEHPEEQI